MFDGEGNAWVVDNFMVGAQNQDYLLEAAASRSSPPTASRSRRPLPVSPAAGFAAPVSGLAIDAHDNVWTTSFGGQQHNFDVRQ